MPKRSKRRKARKTPVPPLTAAQAEELIVGPSASGSVFGSDEERRKCWERYSNVIERQFEGDERVDAPLWAEEQYDDAS